LVTSGTEQQIEQIVKHLNRLIDVVKVLDLTEGAHIERELMLIKLHAVGEARDEYKRLTEIFRGDIIDVTATTYTVQMVGESKKLDAFIDALDSGLILETVRSGTVGVMRGEKCLHI
jgi:acetolactate synthase-1/3 small subunit